MRLRVINLDPEFPSAMPRASHIQETNGKTRAGFNEGNATKVMLMKMRLMTFKNDCVFRKKTNRTREIKFAEHRINTEELAEVSTNLIRYKSENNFVKLLE